METVGDKKDLCIRLRRIEGQVKGIERMIESGDSCKDILTQISAARAALNKVGILLFEKLAKTNIDLIGLKEEDKINELIDNLTVLLNKFQ